MRNALAFTAMILIGSAIASADEIKAESKIESIGLFKNGLAVVERSVPITGPGVYLLDHVPAPVHGTFWVEGDVDVESRVTMRDVDGPPSPASAGSFQESLVGKEVTIRFRDGNIPECKGKVIELAKATGEEAWDRTYQRQNQYGYGNAPAGSNPFLVVDTDKGRTYVESSLIAYVQVEGGRSVHSQRPVLLLTVGNDQKGPGTLHVSYLTRGLAWAPSYRINLLDDKTLDVEQQAVVKNELADLNDCEMQLISGYPSVEFANVVSPLSLSQSWSQFFAQISQPPQEVRGVRGNAMAQQARSNSANSDGEEDLPAIPTPDGVDVHYQSMGKRTLAEGDSVSMPVAHGRSDYDRIVEWVVPDTRDVNGRFIEDYRRQQEPEKFEDSAWDAVKFKNPLPFAMTTAPAMILDAGRFAGQRMSFWVNSGEETTLQITKALSLRTRSVEQEDQNNDRQQVWVGGSHYRKVSVKGELTVGNHRAKDIHLVIRRQFSGELGKAEREPKLVLREEGAYSVNRRNELTWKIDMKSGEEATIKYDYTLLVAD